MEIEFDESGDICIVDEEPFTEKLNATDLCRLCANTDNQLMPIFRGEGLEHNISSKIKKHLPIINISESDNLPLQICYQCASTLISWHNLYEGCPIANKRLHEILDKKYQDISIENDVSLNNFEPKSLIDENTNRFDDFSDDNQGAKFSSTESPRQMISIMPSDNLIVNVTTDELINEERLETVEAQPADTSQKKYVNTSRKRRLCSSKNKAKLPDQNLLKLSTNEQNVPFDQTTVEIEKSFESDSLHVDGNILRNIPNEAKSKPSDERMVVEQSSALSMCKPCVVNINKSTIDQKLKAAKNNTLFFCDLCSVLTVCREDLITHWTLAHQYGIEIVTPGKFKCQVCSYESSRRFDIMRHILNLHAHASKSNKNNFPCPSCQESFRRQDALRSHFSKCHIFFIQKEEVAADTITSISGFFCDVCGRGYEKLEMLLAHRDIQHHTSAPLSWDCLQSCHGALTMCASCGGYFSRSHSRGVLHSSQCEPGTSDINGENKVAILLKGPPLYKCDVCSLCFIWKLLYRQHRGTTHPEAKPLDWTCVGQTLIAIYCELCYLAFDSMEEYDQHQCFDFEIVDIHSSEQPHNLCHLCNKRFKLRSSLSRHQNEKHSCENVKPNACHLCQRSFELKSGLMRHLKKKHNWQEVQRIVCHLCDKRFKLKSSLSRHLQEKHNWQMVAEKPELLIAHSQPVECEEEIETEILDFTNEMCDISDQVLRERIDEEMPRLQLSSPVKENMENEAKIEEVNIEEPALFEVVTCLEMELNNDDADTGCFNGNQLNGWWSQGGSDGRVVVLKNDPLERL